MQGGNHAEACRKFEESQRLDPGGGTLLNLALCHEAEGRTATAWSELHEAIAVATRDGRNDRRQIARERLDALEPRLSRLTVLVPPEADAPGIQVTRDGTPLARIAWGTAMPVDPGSHLVEASAPGMVTWRATLVIDKPGETQQVTVPPLVSAPRPAGPGSASTAQPQQRASVPRQLSRDTSRTSSAGPPLSGWIVGGAGVVAIAAGAVVGISSLQSYDQAEGLCPDHKACNDDAIAADDAAQTKAWISNIAIGVGIVAVGVGGYLLLSSSSRGSSTAIVVHGAPGAGTAQLRIRH